MSSKKHSVVRRASNLIKHSFIILDFLHPLLSLSSFSLYLTISVANKNCRLILATYTRSLAKPQLLARRSLYIRGTIFTASCRHYEAPLFTDSQASRIPRVSNSVRGRWYTTPFNYPWNGGTRWYVVLVFNRFPIFTVAAQYRSRIVFRFYE